MIVIGWQVYDIARATMDMREAAFQLGLIGLVQFVPLFLLTPVSGGRRPARPALRRPGGHLLEMICALILASLTAPYHHLPILFGVAALLGVARAFAGPRSRRWRPISSRARCCPTRSR